MRSGSAPRSWAQFPSQAPTPLRQRWAAQVTVTVSAPGCHIICASLASVLTRVSLGGNSLLDYEPVLGPQHLSYKVARQPGERKIRLYIEGLSFPDANFSGLVSLSVSLVEAKVGAVPGAETGSGGFRAQQRPQGWEAGAGAPGAR